MIEFVPLVDGDELKRKKLRLTVSELLGDIGDFDPKWVDVEVDSTGGLFKRRYERFDDESDDDDDGWLFVDDIVIYEGGDFGESGELKIAF